MSLMISVSGIRGIVGESLTPTNLTAFATAFASWAETRKKEREPNTSSRRPHIVIGRDTRPTGETITGLVQSVLVLSGCNVTDIGIATTPTVELAVTEEKADGGLIITASHNPVEWNALKMLNHRGEFLDAEDVDELMRIASVPTRIAPAGTKSEPPLKPAATTPSTLKKFSHSPSSIRMTSKSKVSRPRRLR